MGLVADYSKDRYFHHEVRNYKYSSLGLIDRLVEQEDKAKKEESVKLRRKRIVGSFGIRDAKANKDIIINWVESKYRRRIKEDIPVERSKYAKSLYESMFKGWG